MLRSSTPLRFLLRGAYYILTCLAACSISAVAQTSNVTVMGTVADKTGSVIPEAKVSIRNEATGEVKSVPAGQNGQYVILNVEPGSYEIRAESSGFATAVKNNLVVYVGQTVTLNFTLQIAASAQTVEVQAESTMVTSRTDSMVARIIQPKELDNLPLVDRSFTDLAALSPGVEVTSSASPAGAGVGAGNGISIGAAPGYQTGYIVDGSWDEVSGLGGAYINYAQDWIQEFSLVAQQAPAQYGGASGGFVNAITRSGGNQFHGRAYIYYQNAALNATPDFLPKSAPTKPPYNQERAGGMLGGPIKKDKVFFFGGWEYFHDLNSIPVNVPAAFVGPASTSGVFSQSFQTNLAMAKVDYQMNANNKFSGRFNFEHDNNQNVGIGASGSSVHTLGNATNQTPHDITGQFHWWRTLSASALNEVLFTYNYQLTILQCPYAVAVGNYPGSGTGSDATEGGNPTGWWAQTTYPTAGVVTGCAANTGDASPTPTQNALDPSLNDVYSVTHGSNDLKFGVGIDIEQTGSVRTRNNYNGQYSINGSIPFDPSVTTTFPTSDFMLFGGGNFEHNKTVGPDYSFFAEDTLKVKENLTLNIGIRYDFNTMNTWMTHHYILNAMKTNTVAQLNALNNDYSNLAPRFGFAWSPFRDNGKTVLRGGVGVFYDEDKTAADYIYLVDGIATVNGGAVNLNASRPSLNPYCLGYVSCASGAVPAQEQQYVEEVLAYALSTYTIPNFNLGTYTLGPTTYTVPVPTLGLAGTGGLAPTTGGTNAVDPNLKTPGEVQVSVGVGHDVNKNMNFAADYVYTKGFQQIIIRNTNISMQGLLVNPAFGSISSSGNNGMFTDKSLRVKISYLDQRGDGAQVAYALGWANDNSYNAFGINSHTINETDPFNYNVDYGPSTTDARHILNVSGTLEGPIGFQLAPIFSFTSPLAYSATTSQTTAVPGCQVYYNQCYPVGYTKGSLRGADTVMLNSRLAKNFHLGEKKSIHAFFEGYNLLNRSNYGTNFQANVLSSTFGQPTADATNKRQLQIGGRFDF
jgi:hypothetical protein